MSRRFRALAALSAVALIACSTAAGDIGWYAKWGGRTPITVRVAGVGNLPAEQQPLFAAAMGDWSLPPSVDVTAGSGKVKVTVDTRCPVACTQPNASNGVLHGATIHINPQVFAWSDAQWVYCHELGHALGLGEPDPSGDYGSCMTGSSPNGGLHPSQQDYDTLAVMYP